MNFDSVSRILEPLLSRGSSFALFQGDDYGDGMGWDHFTCVGKSIEELELKVNSDWYQIVDLSILKIVKQGSLTDVCSHQETYTVREMGSVDGAIIVSGQLSMPGVYCSSCHKRL